MLPRNKKASRTRPTGFRIERAETTASVMFSVDSAPAVPADSPAGIPHRPTRLPCPTPGFGGIASLRIITRRLPESFSLPHLYQVVTPYHHHAYHATVARAVGQKIAYFVPDMHFRRICACVEIPGRRTLTRTARGILRNCRQAAGRIPRQTRSAHVHSTSRTRHARTVPSRTASHP